MLGETLSDSVISCLQPWVHNSYVIEIESLRHSVLSCLLIYLFISLRHSAISYVIAQ
jgi:hypothetical protein